MEVVEGTGSRASSAADLIRYDLSLERVRLRLLRTLGAAEPARVEADLENLDRQLANQPAGRLERLARRLALSAEDVDLLWTVIAVSHDPRSAAHAAALAGHDHRGGVSLTLHVLSAELPPTAARVLALRINGNHPLLRHQVLVVRGETPGMRTLHAPDRIAGYLAGGDDLDPDLVDVGTILPVAADAVLSRELRALVDTLVHVLSNEQQPLVILEGAAGLGRRTLVALAADEANRTAVCLDAARVPRTGSGLDHALGSLRREVLVRDRAFAVIADADEFLDREGDTSRVQALARAIEAMHGPVVLTTSLPGFELPTSRTPMRLRVAAPTAEVRELLWKRQLADTEVAVDALSLRYRLGPGVIEAAARSAHVLARAGGRVRPGERDLVDGVRTTIAERMGGLATRIEPRQSWDELVLQPDTRAQIRSLIARVRHAHAVLDGWGFRSRMARGAGVAALFSGPPGTGKTMVAGLIAHELDLELYQVDLSRVVSKWVGETEKQLAQIFDAAESGHALLLFDEADALFAKRTEVKAAVDRYANLEVNYLLQRVEAFGGVTILTTNMDTSIDPALRRRLSSHVVFWPPDVDERILLWEKMIPTIAPREGKLDLEKLAEDYPDMSGAHIRNAAVSAAFLAADEGARITQAHLERAARAEYRAMGHVLGKRGSE